MRAVIQRVRSASVSINGKTRSAIESGILIYLGVELTDTIEDADWLSRKIAALRIFDDQNGVMNLDVKQSGGEIMVISQFTLHAKTKKGNRPSYIRAAPPDFATPLYLDFIKKIGYQTETIIKTGEFGAMMEVKSFNSGPVTIIIDTKNKE